MESEKNEVVEMFHAIRNGKPYALNVKVPEGEPGLILRFGESGDSGEISLYGSGGFATAIDDPNIAREIAGALVTWANKQEGRSFTGEEMDGAMTLFGWANVQDIHHPVNQTRAKWYDDMVGVMTIDALKRNYADLRIVAKRLTRENVEHNTGWDNLSDVRRAIGVCHSEFQKRGYKRCPTWGCGDYFSDKEITEHIKSHNENDRV